MTAEPSILRAYGALLSARFRVGLQYRAAAIAGFGTQVFWGLIRVMIFGAFFESTSAAQPMTYADVVTYVWLGQATLMLILWGADAEVRDMVRQGTVAYELVRPLDLYSLWFCRSIAARTAATMLRAVPMTIIAGLFFGLAAPVSATCGALWVAATLLALLLSAAFSTLLSVVLLWTISGEGFARLLPVFIWILSGLVLPLPLFPDWAQSVIRVLPFRALMDTPFRLYMGHISPTDALPALAHQAIWLVAIVLLGRWLLSRGVRRLVVQGG